METYMNFISFADYVIPTIKTVFALTALSWLILIVSKVVMKEYFFNRFWKYGFLMMIAFPTVVDLYLCGTRAFIEVYFSLPGYVGIYEEFSGYPLITDFVPPFAPFFILFALAYAVHFMIVLVRFMKTKVTD
ncbi:MAG TPA: hypothetical protein PKD52_04780 [Clostridiales bacterium]|nr:hypothetical protein [Clostridiales bacterium]